jgi:hypothetical protein
MGISREEFFRLLPGAVRSYEVDGDTVRWSEGGRGGTIRLVRLEDRRIGSVVIPRHSVEIALDADSEADGEAFLARFLRAFLRGGG